MCALANGQLSTDNLVLTLKLVFAASKFKLMKGLVMKWEQIEANWDVFKNIIKHDWDKLTAAQLEVIAGRRDYLIRSIQSVYGLTAADVEAQLSDWQKYQINIDGHFYQSKPFLSAQSSR